MKPWLRLITLFLVATLLAPAWSPSTGFAGGASHPTKAPGRKTAAPTETSKRVSPPPDWTKGTDHRFDDLDPERPTRPWYYTRALTPGDLDGRNLRELSVLRNWIFARAGNPFRREWLHGFFAAQPWYKPLPAMDAAKITELDRGNAAFIAGYEAAIPRNRLEEHLAAHLALEDSASADPVEIELTRERLGVSGTGDAAGASPLIHPDRLDKLLTIEDLNDFSRRDLSLLRNMVYARRQRPFASPELRAFFERYAWYAADATYTDDRLTPIDTRNINLIQSVEEELGGPVDKNGGAFWFGSA